MTKTMRVREDYHKILQYIKLETEYSTLDEILHAMMKKGLKQLAEDEDLPDHIKDMIDELDEGE